MKIASFFIAIMALSTLSACSRQTAFERRMDDAWDDIESYILTMDGNREGVSIERFDFLCYTFELEGFLPSDICMYFVTVTHPFDRNNHMVISHRFDENGNVFAHEPLINDLALDAEMATFKDFLTESEIEFEFGQRN